MQLYQRRDIYKQPTCGLIDNIEAVDERIELFEYVSDQVAH